MKKFNLFTMLMSVATIVSLIVVSAACTKEGPAGKDGVDGQDGEPGINGQDGTATCAVCHDNSEEVEIKTAQWGKSIHAIGGRNFENATGCAPCHTSQGFKEVVNTAATATAAAIENPANINCYTCHKVHDSYSEADWELRKTTDITFWLTGETFNFGKGNICAQCHQPRISYQIPDVSQPAGSYTFTSKRFGPHHGSQGATFSGSGYYKTGTGLANSAHFTMITDACVTCHMASPIGFTAGGHSFNMYDEEEAAYNFAGCVACHTDEDVLAEDLTVLQDSVAAKMTRLGDLLVAKGIYNPASTSGYAIPGTYTNDVAGAYWNFISILEDRSEGVHNPTFVLQLLDNSIDIVN
jgi:hypothetical protein